MSRYYEVLKGDFGKVKKDILDGKIKEIRVVNVKNKDLGFESEESLCVTDGKNFVYLREGDVKGGLGLKVWGGNDENKIIDILEGRYGNKFICEEDLGIMHLQYEVKTK